MATLASTQYTLADYATRTNPDGSAAKVAELLNTMNGLTANIPYQACNDSTGHNVYLRTELPTADFIQLGNGVPLGKSKYERVREATGAIGLAHQVPEDVLKASGNPAAQRALDAYGVLEAINQKAEDAFFYGSRVANPLGFNGLATRLNAVTAGTAYADRVFKAGGSGSDNTSIYLCVFGPGLAYGIHPTAFPMGIEADVGTIPDTVMLANGNVSKVFTDKWTMHLGLAIEDPRAVSRVGNIDVSDLAGGSPADLIGQMTNQFYACQDVLSRGRAMFFVNRTIAKYLDKQVQAKVNTTTVTHETVDGKPVLMFRGIPIVTADKIRNNESLIP